MVLEWDAPPEGWKSTYTVKVIPRSEAAEESNEIEATNRTRREEMLDNVTEIEYHDSRPPINVSDLAPESKYDLIITTSLSPDWSSTVLLEDVATTANSSKLPEGIVGVTMVPGEYQAAQFSLFTIAIAMLTAAIVIFVISGTLPIYADNAMQVCFDVCLLCSIVAWLLAVIDGPLAWDPKNQTACLVSVFLLSFFTLASFAFLLLEAVCIARGLVKGVRCPIADKIAWMVAIGLLAPLVYAAIAVAVLRQEFVPTYNRV